MKLFTTLSLVFACVLSWGQKYEPIVTREDTAIDTFFTNYIVEDKYRWLENTNSLEAQNWVEQQYKLSTKYLSKVVNSTSSYRIIDKYSYVKFKNLVKMGKYYFKLASYNEGVPALFYQSKISDEPEVLVDPNLFSIKDRIIINDYAVSKDSKLLAYKFSVNGSDWNEVKVISLVNGIHTEDHLKGLKFSSVSWLGNGFFYTTYSQKSQFGVTNNQKIFYHKIGNQQQQDSLIFESMNNMVVDLNYLVTSDERFFVLEEINKSKKAINYYYIDFKAENPAVKPLVINQKANINILDSPNGKFIATQLSQDSNNGSILEIDPKDSANIRTIVEERTDTLLLKVIPFADRMVAVYQTSQRPIIMIIDYSGKVLYRLKLPIASSADGFYGSFFDEDLLFSYTTYTLPPVMYKFNIKTFNKELVQKVAVNFDIDKVEYKEVEYLSKDSVKIPMILVYEKGIKLDGKNPTILKAYGGFGIVETPSFDAGVVYFIKQGGIYAFANIRGGGDKGVSWARQGRGKNKQKSFDDFIAAAEYLINNKYTSSDKLAITGASNGGLVVAAAAIQRPDLFKAVVPVVAPLDMIRFEKFTVGHWHTREYGSVSDSLGFLNIRSYSPYYNIKEDVNYPSMLIATSEYDDRVPPFHSYKFAARLQSRSAQKNPIILRVEKKGGHNGASTMLMHIQEKADVYGFILNELRK